MKPIRAHHRVLSTLLACVCLMTVVFLLSGCQTTDTNAAYMWLGEADTTTFAYDEETNRTKVTWYATLENRTIYTFHEFKIEYELYNDTATDPIAVETFYYDQTVVHGKSHSGYFHFTVDGEVTRIERTRWAAHYETLWGTYKIWFIVAIILVLLASFIYSVFIFVTEADLLDVIDDLEDMIYIPIIFGCIFGGSALWGAISSNWVNSCIVGGAIVVFAVLAMTAHLIQYILIEKMGSFCRVSTSSTQAPKRRSEGKDRGEEDEGEDDIEQFDSVEDCADDPEGLNQFTKKELTEFCRENGVSGYSGKNKDELIRLIVESRASVPQGKEDKSSQSHSKTASAPIRFSDIAGLEEAKNAFHEKVIMPFEHKELFERYGKKVGGGLLLYGLPGTGKTMFAEACANELNALFIPIKCSDIKSKWYGESEANVKKIFAKARKAERAIIFFDEFEAIGAKRTDNPDNSNNDLVPQILAEMQGVGSASSEAVILVIAATNKPWAIDSAFLRPGRFDEKICIPLPDAEARKHMFTLKLRSVPTKDLDYDRMAALTEGYNGADITEFCEKLKLEAIKKTVSTGKEHAITMEDVMSVGAKTVSSVSEEDVEQLLAFEGSV